LRAAFGCGILVNQADLRRGRHAVSELLLNLDGDRVTVRNYTIHSKEDAIMAKAQIQYFPEVECEVTPSSLFDTEVVGVPDETGNHHYLRVARGVVNRQDDKTYLPVGIVEVDAPRRRALVQLPYEADSGANRLWVPYVKFRQIVVYPEEIESFA